MLKAAPEYNAFHEYGFMVITDPAAGVVLGCRMANPVEVGVIAGEIDKLAPALEVPPPRIGADKARFVRIAGVDFLNSTNRFVIIVADRDAGYLRILQFHDQIVHTVKIHPKPPLRPTGVATITRFEASDCGTIANVGVTSEQDTAFYLVRIKLEERGYSATAISVKITGDAVPHFNLALSGIASQATGPVHTSELKKRRDAALAAATNDHERTAARAQFAGEVAIRNSMVVYLGRRGQPGSQQAALVRVDLSDLERPTARTNENVTKEYTCPGSIMCELEHDPFDLNVDCMGYVYTGSIESARLFRASPRADPAENDGWHLEVYAGPETEPRTLETVDGEARSSSFAGIAGIATYQAGRTVFVIEHKTHSIAKISNFGDAFIRWAEPWMKSCDAVGEKDPGDGGTSENLTWMNAARAQEEAAVELKNIAKHRADAIGVTRGEGPEAMMCTESLHAHTETSVPTLRIVGEHLGQISSSVASKLKPQATKEKNCERWWARVRLSTLDSAFDQRMYVQLVPRVFVETLKQMCAVGFVTSTILSKKTAYSLRSFGVRAAMKYVRLMGSSLHRPRTVMERTGEGDARTFTGRVIPNRAGIWEAVGQVFRFERRTDHRRLARQASVFEQENASAGTSSLLSEPRFEPVLKFMRLAERMVKRMRETKLRDRMRQTLGYSYPWLEPEYRAVDNDIAIEQEPIDGSAASLLPLLTKGDIIMLRDPECYGPGPNIGWTLAQLLEDFKRPSVLTVGSQLRVLQSNWNADTGGFEFVDAPNSRLLCGYGNFFRVDEAVHRSALLVVEPDGGIEYPADSSVLFLCKLKHEQVTEFNRITRRDSARPDWQHEWWLPVKPESERPQWQGARVVDLHEREYVLAEEPIDDINPDARRSDRVRYTPRPPAAPAALPTVPTRGRGRGRRGRR